MDITDSRQDDRYTLTTRLEGNLGGVDVVLVDLGPHGVQVKHPTPMKLGTVGKLTFRIPGEESDVRLPGHVVWSRLSERAGPDGERPYYSGVRLDDPDGTMASILGRMLNTSVARADEESLGRKRKMLEARERSKQQPGVKFFGANVPRVPDDVILLVRQTRLRLQANPTENVKWLNRAKYSLDEAGVQIHHREDVLAVWEYLERSVQLDIIARILDTR